MCYIMLTILHVYFIITHSKELIIFINKCKCNGSQLVYKVFFQLYGVRLFMFYFRLNIIFSAIIVFFLSQKNLNSKWRFSQ
jgi:hypothetical protein